MDLTQFIAAYWKPLLKLFAGYYVLASAIMAMPTPKNGNQLYKFFFRFTHLLAGNAARVIAVWGKGTAPAAEEDLPQDNQSQNSQSPEKK